MSTNLTHAFRRMVPRYLKREWRARDGLSSARLDRAARRLKLPYLPASMRAMYLAIGAVDELCRVHNEIRSPEDVYFEGEYLMLMDENQAVVSWGIARSDLRSRDPEIWQLNNATGEWYSEEKPLVPLLTSMFDWYEEVGVW